MSGTYQYDVEIKSNVAKLLSDMKQVQDRLDTVEGKEYKIKLNVDEKKLSNVISNLEKMLDSFGKGTGDFKQFENLSKELSSIVSEVQSLSKAFGKLDDSGTKTLLSSIQNIDNSLSELSQNILNVNKNMSNMGGNTSGAVKQVENISNAYQNAAKEAEKLADAQSKIGQKTNISSEMKDAFPNANTKLDEVVTSAKDLDKTFEQVDIPTDSFDKVLEKLDITKSELVDIVKITKQSVSDADGKFHDSYTLKDSRGSTEIYGVNSKTDKGQILRQNIVGYDVKKDTVDNSKELLAIEKQLQKEIEASDKANQKKFQDFQKEQADYAESVNKVNSAIQKTDEILDTLPLHDKLDGQFLDMIDSVDNLNSKLKSGELTLSEYKNEVKSVTSEYSKMVSIQQKRDVEDYNANAKANLENAKNIQSEWDKNIKAIQDYMDAMTKLNNLKAKDKGTGSETNQIELQTQNVEKLKQVSFEARKNLSSMQAENPDIITWKQWVDMMKLFDQASKGSAESAAKLKDVLDNIKVPSLDKYENKLSSYLNKTGGYNATIARFNDGGWTSDTYLKNVQAVRDAVKQYATLLDNIKANQNGIASDEDIQNLDKYEKKIKETIATVTNMSAAEKGYNFVSGQKELDKIHKLLNENSKMSSEAKAKIKAYYAEIESGNPSMSLDKIHGEILKIYNAEVEAGRAGRTLWDTLKNSGFHQLAAQMAGMFGFYDVINLGKEGFNVVRELNTALTEMRKVSDETVQSLKDYQATTFDTADAVGTTAKQIQNSTADWMRLGESMNQAAESAKDANVLLNVSEFEGIDEATESLVSMSQAYKDLDKMDIIDVLNNIGNNYSISTDGLATALKDSASALVTANNDLNEAVSLTTAGNAITQDPSKVGAGLRTISLRLVGTEEAKQELSDLGEETDGMITTVSKLRDTIMDATKAASSDGKGFDILDSNGNYKSTYEIMQGLADLYDNIVKKDKELGTNNLNLLLETIAGKNRANIAASILQNGDMLRSVYEDAQNSDGSAEKELNSYLDSIDGKMAQLENRAQEFWFKVIDSETIKNGIDLLSTLLKGATDFVDTVGLLPTILTGVGAALSFKNVGRDKMYSLSFEYADNIHNLLWIQRFKVCYP